MISLTEKWLESQIKDIFVSNLGNIQSQNKKYYEFCFNGYKAIRVYNKTYYIHRLVAKAFVPNLQSKPCVNHIDGDKLNNNANNLEWVTYSENNKHAYKIGLKKPLASSRKHKNVCMLDNKKEIICIFPKLKNANVYFNKKISPNITRAIKRGIKCEGYYWEYYYDNDLKTKKD